MPVTRGIILTRMIQKMLPTLWRNLISINIIHNSPKLFQFLATKSMTWEFKIVFVIDNPHRYSASFANLIQRTDS